MEKGQFWQEGVVYQIYPRSFMDSNGDGIGDLQGIIGNLDYLKELGVGIVWLSPVYSSPNDDNGYDISDYRAIMEEFGTMEDWEELLQGLHARGIRLIMDLVVNHSSDEHAWFRESRQSKDNPYREYYIWRPGKPDGTEPNNWVSFFGGSAWQYDETTDEYYLHLFTKKQPDLNWENPQLRREVYDMMKFWLDKGIDGFRMDVINCISKADGLPSAGSGRYAWGGEFFLCGPRLSEFLREMNEEVLSKYDAMSVGEMPGVTTEQAAAYTDPANRQVNMVFQFETMDIDAGEGGKWNLKPWKLADLKAVTSKWQYGLNGRGWNSLYLNNHDQPRMVSRFGSDVTETHRRLSAKLLATFLHTLQGTPYIYQGEEIGMTNVRFESLEDYRDVETMNFYREAVGEWGWTPERAMASIYAKGRDNARTPMQWSDAPQGGFTTGDPWIAANPNYRTINVEESRRDPDSIFHYYRKLIALRREHPVMIYGSYDIVAEENERIYAYTRTLGEERWLVALNFTGEEAVLELPAALVDRCDGSGLIVSNYTNAPQSAEPTMRLRPYEARVYRLTL